MNTESIPETHAPAPWGLNDRREAHTMVVDANGRPLCRMLGYSSDADRRLMVAAPDLLAVCRTFVAMYDGLRDVIGPTVTAKLAIAEAAIANATLVLVFLLFASVAQAELRIPVIVLVSGQAADVLASKSAFARGCHEVNGLYGSARPSMGRLLAVKALAVGPALAAMWFAERSGHGRWATALGFVGGGIGAGAAVSNALQSCGGGR